MSHKTFEKKTQDCFSNDDEGIDLDVLIHVDHVIQSFDYVSEAKGSVMDSLFYIYRWPTRLWLSIRQFLGNDSMISHNIKYS